MKIIKQQILKNAQKIKQNGLEEKIVKIAEKVYESAKQKTKDSFTGNVHTHIYSEEPIAQILGLFGGSLKGVKVLDLGCGYNRDYSPVLSTALASLGANVTGIDLTRADKEDKIRIFKKYGFYYIKQNLTQLLLEYTDEESKKAFKNNDLIIAHSLLFHGLMIEDFSCGHYYQLDDEWIHYGRIIKKIQEFNSKDSLYFLQIPNHEQFKYGLRGDETKKEKDKYVFSKFKDEFGGIILGREKPGQHVFTFLNKYGK